MTISRSPSNTLVYSIAVGDECWNMAKLMVHSLRTFGKFTGDIRIYSDRGEAMIGADVVRCPDLLALPNPMFGKSAIGRNLHCSQYDRVVWMDADIVTIRPVQGAFNSIGLRAPAESLIRDEWGISHFSLPEHPCPLGTLGVNAGLIVGDSKEWNSMCATWWSTLMDVRGWERHPQFYDQEVFNHLIRHGAIRLEAFPLGVMHFMVHGAADVGPETVFIHARAPIKFETMKCLTDLLSQFHKTAVIDIVTPPSPV